jgi:DHA1 family bicyclomycin/chloramphenicol resistance-like MFS transporter
VPYVQHSLQWMAISQAILVMLALLLWLSVRRQIQTTA